MIDLHDRRSRRLAYRTSAAAIFALLIPGTSAFAGTDAGAGSSAGADSTITAGADISVTARKRTERLQDVPLSISAVGSETLARQKIDKLQDLVQNIPNFTPITQNPRTSSLSIRGIGGVVGGADGSESGAGLIIDNVFLTYVGFAFQPLYDLAAVEVARGPQGTLLGKNTTVGATIIRTQAPTFTPGAEAEISPYNAGGLLIKSYINLPLTDTLATRVSFFREKNDGFYPTNPNPLNDNGRSTINGNNTNRWAVRGQLLWKPAPNITDRLIVNHSESAENNNYNSQFADDFTQLANGTPIQTVSTFLKSYYGLSSAALPNNLYASTQTNQSEFLTRYTGVSNELNVDFGWANLTSITAFEQYDLLPRNTQGYLGYYWESLGYDNHNKTYSQEFRLAGKFGKTIDWTVGLYGLIDRRNSNDRLIYGKDAGELFAYTNNLYSAGGLTGLTGLHSGLLGNATTASVLAQDPTIANALNNTETHEQGLALTHSGAIFAQATWHVTNRLDLTGGIRFTDEYRKGDVISEQVGGSTYTGLLPSNVVPYSQLTPLEQVIRTTVFNARGGAYDAAYLSDVAFAGSAFGPSHRTTSSVSWLINPSYKLSRDILLYFSASHGEKSGVINTGSQPIFGTASSKGAVLYNGRYVTGIQPLLTKPEKAQDYELGFKSVWFNRRFVLNANIYQNTITDYQGQITDTVSFAPQVVSFVGNIPKIRLRGLEVEASLRVNPWLQVHANGARTGAKYLDFPTAGYPVDLGAGYSSLSGTDIPNVSPWTINAGIDWDKPIGQFLNNDVALFGFINEAIKGSTRFSDIRSTIYLGQPTYGLTNVSIGIRRLDDRLSLSVWSKNLFNQGYAIPAGVATNSNLASATATYPTFATYTPGEPRTYGLTLTGKF